MKNMFEEMMAELRRFNCDFRCNEQTHRFWWVAANREIEAVVHADFVEVAWTRGIDGHSTKTTAHSAAMRFWELQSRI